MPKQNRPIIRDGRIQTAKKKRTDRRYLRTGGAPAAVERVPVESDELEPSEESAAFEDAALEIVADEMDDAPSAAVPVTRLPAAARALQHHGQRRRREVDVDALIMRDSEYAVHEIRRIAVLAVMVIVTLVVLTIVLR